MKCLVHIWRSLDPDENRFVLRMTPLASGPTAFELFPNELSLTRRLTEIGLTRSFLQTTLANLRDTSNAIWPNYDVADHVFFPEFALRGANQNEEEL
jgi:hypothetical protein